MKYGTVSQRKALLAASQKMSRSGLSPGKSGNLSLRTPYGCLITPTGIPYQDMSDHDLVAMKLDGTLKTPRQRKPSSEWHFHLAIYKAYPEVRAIVHAHSLAATSLACLELSIPAFHYMVGALGGDTVRCAKYATFGTEELAVTAVKALKDRKGCLLAHHGQITTGDSIEGALDLAFELESLCQQYAMVRTLSSGKPKVLSKGEMRRVLSKFKGYGQQD